MQARARILFLSLIVFISSFLILWWFSTSAADFVNMDTMLYGETARNIVRGVPYSEIRWIDRPLDYIQLGGIPKTSTWPVSPFYAFMVASFFSIFGISFTTMKIVGVVFGSLSVLSTFHLARILSNEKWGLLAASLLMMHPFFIYNSIIPGNEVFTAFFSTSALLFSFLRNRKGLMFQGLFSALAFMSRYEVGALCLLSIIINHSFHSSQDSDYSIKKDLGKKALLLLSFASTLLPLIYYNSVFYKTFLVLPSLSTRIFFGDVLATNFYVSPLIFIGTIFLLLVSSLSLSILLMHLKTPLKSMKPSLFVVLSVSLVATFLVGSVPYLAELGDYSPIFFVFGLTGLFISLKVIRKYSVLFLFIFLSILLYYFLAFRLNYDYTQPRYAVTLMPILAVFGSLAVSRILCQLRLTSFSLPLRLSTARLVSILLLATVLTSSFIGYGVLNRSTAITKGPFTIKNWDNAKSWISNNTEVNDTIIAMWPVPLFYCDRRTVTLLPENRYENSELYSIINQSRASYLVIDYDMRYMVTNSLIASLYDDPKNYEGFKLVYQTGSFTWEDPRLVIYELSFDRGST